jgi:hypothetical protein
VIHLAIAILLGVTTQAHSAALSDGRAIAHRLIAAIKGKAEFRDADFARKFGERDKAALRQASACKLLDIGFSTISPDVMIENPDEIAVGFRCKGVPRDTPVMIHLSLRDGKIVKVETNNFDLMGAE